MVSSENKIGKLLPFAIFIVVFLIYLPTLFHSFVYDDMEQVLSNPWIRDFSHLGDIFFSPTWAFMKEAVGSNYYRPLMHLVFLFEYKLFGLSSVGFHLYNALVHALNSALVFLTISAFLRPAGVDSVDSREVRASTALFLPLMGALVFALHPINSEVVNWVSAMPELTYTLFLLLALYLYIKIDNGEATISNRVFSLIFFFLALLSKETAMVFLFFMFAFDFSRAGVSFVKRYKNYLPYLATAIVYLVLRTYALKGFAQKEMVSLSAFESLLNIFPALLRYSLKLIWPSNLSVIYTYEPVYSLLNSFVILSLLLTIALIIFMVMFRRSKGVFFSVLWIFIPLLPVLYIPVVSIGGFADRYLYLPSAGFGLLIAFIIVAITARLRFGLRVLVITSLVLLVVYGSLSVKRFSVWKSSMNLWRDTARTAPESTVVNLGIAAAYRELGDNINAIKYYGRVQQREPGNYKAHYNQALIYQDMGDIANAERHYIATIRANPLDDKAYFNLASLYNKAGNTSGAIDLYKEAIRLNPSSDRARHNLAQLYKESGNLTGALDSYREMVALNPMDSSARYNLAWALQEAGDNQGAINSFKEAVRLDPMDARALYALGWVYHFIGDTLNAERYYTESVKAAPNVPDAYFNLGLIYSGSGNYEEAVRNYEKVLEIDPAYREAGERLRRAKASIKSNR
jgi:tetratricopeptide (TPR) repeat protein